MCSVGSLILTRHSSVTKTATSTTIIHDQCRRNRGFRRFNKLGSPRALRGATQKKNKMTASAKHEIPWPINRPNVQKHPNYWRIEALPVCPTPTTELLALLVRDREDRPSGGRGNKSPLRLWSPSGFELT